MRAELRHFVSGANYLTPAHPVMDLIAFGQETVDKFAGQGYYFVKINVSEGNGYIVYDIQDDCIEIIETFHDATIESNKFNILESLIYLVRNVAGSQNKKLVKAELTEDEEAFIRKRNEQIASQNIEDKYKWTLITT